jgi:hypothetical protein
LGIRNKKQKIRNKKVGNYQINHFPIFAQQKNIRENPFFKKTTLKLESQQP